MSSCLVLLLQELSGHKGDVSAADGHVSPCCILSRAAGESNAQRLARSLPVS